MDNSKLSYDETQDHLVVRHPDGTVHKLPVPVEPGTVLQLGRELDNEICLSDPRVSRHHAQIRRAADGSLEVIDLESANGVILGSTRLEAGVWHPVAPGELMQLGDSRVMWEQSLTSRDTVAMTPVRRPAEAKVSAAPAKKPAVPLWLIGTIAGLVIAVLAWLLWSNFNPGPGQPPVPPAGGPADITRQTPETGVVELATATPTESPALLPAVPSIVVERTEFLPVISGALFDTTHVYMILHARVENLGDQPFMVKLNQFSLEADGNKPVKEIGLEFDPSEFKRLGVTDRFDNLNLGSGGSVSEELVFYLENVDYNLKLFYKPEGFEPISLSLGQISAGQELAALLGTPTAAPTEAVAVAGATTEPTSTPTVTATTASASASAAGTSRTISKKSLAGTIAYADFNGSTYDLYFGNVATGESVFWRGESSQPAFNSDGTRIAYHSWASNSRGLITSNLDQTNGFLVAAFLEDQLPTWSPDSSQIMFLSRRTGTRQSQFYLAPSNQEQPSAELLIEAEYPTWHSNGKIAFKGWVTTGTGLRVAADKNSLGNATPLTDFDGDTAPAISPDGKKVVFMSNRNNNWDIYLVNIDGSNLVRLTSDEALDGMPTWSPDGQAIAFVSNRGGPWAVWAMTPTGSGTRQLFTYQGSPDGFVASEPTHDTTRGWAEERLSWTSAVYP